MTQHVHQHHPPVTLDAIAAIRYYVDRIVSSIEGMKVLLLDEETTQIVSTVYSQTTILEREVYLVERLNPDVPHEPMMHLRAVCFLRPTEENAALLARELAQPKYAEYHIFFSNICSANLLRSVAEADELESVRQVQEYYADYTAINQELFSLSLPQPLALSLPNPAPAVLTRTVQGLASALLSFKKKPAQIRYQGTSPAARQVATALAQHVAADQIFEFRRSDGPCLLILDRRDDPVTPLLSQWTYQ
ncbi:vacuolar protein sorting-associated protein 45, partial [Nannochloropsis oceanica]